MEGNRVELLDIALELLLPPHTELTMRIGLPTIWIRTQSILLPRTFAYVCVLCQTLSKGFISIFINPKLTCNGTKHVLNNYSMCSPHRPIEKDVPLQHLSGDNLNPFWVQLSSWKNRPSDVRRESTNTNAADPASPLL